MSNKLRFTEEEIADRQRRVQHIVIEYDQVQMAEREIRGAMLVGKGTGTAKLKMLVAESGCGKSTAINGIAAKLRASLSGSSSQLPILLVSLPKPCTIKTMTTEILRGLGDPLADRHSTTGQNSARIIEQFRAQGVRLGILDEFQHLISGNASANHQEMTDWLKQLLDAAGVPVVCVGLPQSLTIIARHEQLLRRTSKVIRMEPFRWDDEGPEALRFQTFLSIYEKELALPEASNLCEQDFAARLHIASNGFIGTIAQLTFEAIAVSMTRPHGPDCLTKADFAEAYAGLPFEDKNPFDPRKTVHEIRDVTPVISKRGRKKLAA